MYLFITYSWNWKHCWKHWLWAFGSIYAPVLVGRVEVQSCYEGLWCGGDCSAISVNDVLCSHEIVNRIPHENVFYFFFQISSGSLKSKQNLSICGKKEETEF